MDNIYGQGNCTGYYEIYLTVKEIKSRVEKDKSWNERYHVSVTEVYKES